jgi:Icc-related predicted phosphoesterase
MKYWTLIPLIFLLACSGDIVSQPFVDEAVVPSALSHVDASYVLAREWSPDAILIGVDVVVPPGEQASFVQFSFISKTNSKEHLILSYKNGNVTTRISDWSAAFSSFREIELDQWLVDSSEAFEVAQLNGGQEHMLTTSGKIDIKLILDVAKNNTLVWVVSYRSLDGNGTMYIGVEANAGKFMWIGLP